MSIAVVNLENRDLKQWGSCGANQAKPDKTRQLSGTVKTTQTPPSIVWCTISRVPGKKAYRIFLLRGLRTPGPRAPCRAVRVTKGSMPPATADVELTDLGATAAVGGGVPEEEEDDLPLLLSSEPSPSRGARAGAYVHPLPMLPIPETTAAGRRSSSSRGLIPFSTR